MEVVVDQRLPEIDTDVEDETEVGLKARKPRHQYSADDAVVPTLTKVDTGADEPSENIAYLDKNGGALEDLDIHKIMNRVQYDVNDNQITESAIEEITGDYEEIEEEITEEEVVELEFEKAIPKLNTHAMHCPNCDHNITKVVLRRKIIKRRSQITEEPHKPLDLLGCFSCLSLFTSTDNGGFNPFPIFWKKPATQTDGKDVVAREDGNCLSIFRVFGREKDTKQSEPGKVEQDSGKPEPVKVEQDSRKPEPGKVDQDFEKPKPGKVDRDFEKPKPRKFDRDFEKPKPGNAPPTIEDIKYETNRPPNIEQGENNGPNVGGTPYNPKDRPPASHLPSNSQSYLGVKQPEKHESHIDILSSNSNEYQVQTQEQVGQEDSTSFEILKSIVYGGLMEVIASLSVVASAAAGDATTLSIIALAVANLVGGIFVIGHNLWDLRDDCYKFTTSQTDNQEPRNKYKELLGQVEHFPLHMFFAILSFLMFGIIPPLAYGYSFHETNDKDFTMMVVAVASFIGVGLLAIFKAYIDRCTGFWEYVKTIMYYLTTAVVVSGVSYVVGNLVMRLIEELGLFETSSGVALPLLPKIASTNPSLSYY